MINIGALSAAARAVQLASARRVAAEEALAAAQQESTAARKAEMEAADQFTRLSRSEFGLSGSVVGAA